MIKIAKTIARDFFSFLWRLRVRLSKINCNLCYSHDLENAEAYGRLFLMCNECGGIQARELPEFVQLTGMGIEGSWGGALRGGEREHYLTHMLEKMFGSGSILLYGSGATKAPLVLANEAKNITALDVSNEAVKFLNEAVGAVIAYTNRTLPVEKRFDVVIACEVFEHFNDPNYWFQYIDKRLTSDGIICGTTDFYNQKRIDEGADRPGYMSSLGHTFYWSEKSMSWLAKKYNYNFLSFEMQCPGSLFPDPRFGLLFPNKRVFFLTRDMAKFEKLENLKQQSPVLPLDTREYWENHGYGEITQLASSDCGP